MWNIIPGCVSVTPAFTGWDWFLSLVLPSPMLARHVWKHEIKVMYAARPWPTIPVVVVLPNGRQFRVHEDGKVERYVA